MTVAERLFGGGARAILFDLDGTLVDTAPDMVRTLTDLQAANGHPPVAFHEARMQVSNGALGLLRLGFPDADDTRMGELHGDYLSRYASQVCVESTLFPGLGELLTRCEAANVPWGVVTNKPQHLTDPLLAQLGIAARAACAISGDTLPVRKPDPAPLFHASALIGVPAERCVYVGDASRDIEAGRAAGMATVAAAYGYIAPDDRADAWGADRIVANTGDLTTLIEKAVNLDA